MIGSELALGADCVYGVRRAARRTSGVSQLTDLVSALFTGPASCVGGSLAIYDPDQDPEGAGAAQIVGFIRNVLVRPTITP